MADQSLLLGLGNGDPLALGYPRGRRADFDRRLPAEPHHRFRISAASGRGGDLGARYPGAEHWPHGRHSPGEPGAIDSRFLSGSDYHYQPSGTARRRNGYHGFFQYRVFRRSKAERTMAFRFSRGQGRTHLRDESGTRQDSWCDLEFFSTHLRQHGRSRERSEGRAGYQGLWRRSENTRRKGRQDRERNAHGEGD